MGGAASKRRRRREPQCPAAPLGDLITIVYLSQKVKGYFEHSSTIDALVRYAEATNRRLGLSGYLIVAGTYFLQRLEGPREVVFGLLERLRKDYRHQQLLVVEQRPIATLSHTGWGMRVFNLRTGADNQVDAIALMLQALAQGLALGAKAIHPPYFSQILAHQVPRPLDTTEAMLAITISFGPTLVQTGGDGQVAVAGTMLSAMANHLRQRLYISTGSDHGVAFAYLGTAFQAALPLGTEPAAVAHRAVRAAVELVSGQGDLPVLDVRVLIGTGKVWAHNLSNDDCHHSVRVLRGPVLSRGLGLARQMGTTPFFVALEAPVSVLVTEEFVMQAFRLAGEQLDGVLLVRREADPIVTTAGAPGVASLCETAVATLAALKRRDSKAGTWLARYRHRSPSGDSSSCPTEDTDLEWMYQLDTLSRVQEREARRRGLGSVGPRGRPVPPPARAEISPSMSFEGAISIPLPILDPGCASSPTVDDDQLLCILYVSTVTEGTAMTRADLSELGRRAAEFNTQRNVTGFLLFTRPYFLQFLEGPSEAVKRLYRRLRGDPRHTHLTVLVSRIITSRAFEGWSMQVLDLDESAACPGEGSHYELGPMRELLQILSWQFRQLQPWLRRLQHDLLLAGVQPPPGVGVQCQLVAFGLLLGPDEDRVPQLLPALTPFLDRGGELVGLLGDYAVGYMFADHTLTLVEIVAELLRGFPGHAGIASGRMLLLNAGVTVESCDLAFFGLLFQDACALAARAAAVAAPLVVQPSCKVPTPLVVWDFLEDWFVGYINKDCSRGLHHQQEAAPLPLPRAALPSRPPRAGSRDTRILTGPPGPPPHPITGMSPLARGKRPMVPLASLASTPW